MSVDAGTPIALGLPSSAGLFLPANGISENSTQLLLSTNAAAGALLGIPSPYAVPVTKSPAVGSLYRGLQLSFTNPRAGSISGINISFLPATDLLTGEILRFRLPGFTYRTSNPLLRSFSMNLNLSTIEWSQASETLTVVLQRPFDASSSVPITILVPPSANISLPVLGVTRQFAGVEVKIEAVKGPLDWSPIRDLHYVGAFGKPAMLRFEPPKAGELTKISLQYSLEMAIRSGENVTVFIKGFTGPPCSGNAHTGNVSSNQSTALAGNVSSNQSTGGAPATDHEELVCFTSRNFTVQPAGIISHISWFSVSQRLVLTFAKPFVERQLFNLTVPSSFGVRIPPDGLRSRNNASYFSIEVFAADGRILRVPIEDYIPIGALYNTRLVYGNPRVGQASSITLNLEPQMDLKPGDGVILILSEFF